MRLESFESKLMQLDVVNKVVDAGDNLRSWFAVENLFLKMSNRDFTNRHRNYAVLGFKQISALWFAVFVLLSLLERNDSTNFLRYSKAGESEIMIEQEISCRTSLNRNKTKVGEFRVGKFKGFTLRTKDVLQVHVSGSQLNYLCEWHS